MPRFRYLSKEEIDRKNEPPKLTALEEIGNAVTHGIGAGLSIAAFVLLLLRNLPDPSFHDELPVPFVETWHVC